ncbi:GFA family protein [Uliginosibacterium sp. sgz301328]|uniref:GFA family protein n=1 Tax=Uliginosibacterium sp. sgz301328 TaxID=3243764 RepID=UPI00359D3F06
MRTYQGTCHCGAVRFEIDAHIDHVRSCDCSICAKRGALIFRVAPGAFRLFTSMDALSVYRWGSRTAADYFCPTCGVMPFRKPSHPTRAERAAGVRPFDGWAINTRCREGFDPASVPVRRIHGSRLDIEAPEDGPAP